MNNLVLLPMGTLKVCGGGVPVSGTGSQIPVNTAVWHKPCAEAYPAPRILELAYSAGIGLVISSDSHASGEVAREFPRAIALAKAAG